MSKNIADVDKNFKVEAKIVKSGMAFYNIDDAPFKIYGIFRENGKYRRIPEALAKRVSEGVYILHSHTAGGRVRFKTNSSRVAIIAKTEPDKMAHFALTGSGGFDIYVKGEYGYRYLKTYVPPYGMEDGYEGTVDLGTREMRDLTINFPLYSGVSELLIGLDEDAVIAEGDLYKNDLPMVYYGSSITQGGCASRAGTSYQGFISRRFDMDFVNLGFSGNARAEDEMIEYISSLPMSMFIEDYDYNAPTVEHLAATHEKLYKAVRSTHPDIPIIMMSAPTFCPDSDKKARIEVIRTTYNNALAAGDKNVYFIGGRVLMAMAGNEGTVDDCHPTDFGFASMAKALGDLMETIM